MKNFFKAIGDWFKNLFGKKELPAPPASEPTPNEPPVVTPPPAEPKPEPIAHAMTTVPANGDLSDDVAILQERLNWFGANLSVDRKFGSKTTAAVAAFQKEHGLEATGILNAQTLVRLNLQVIPSTTPSNPAEGVDMIAELLKYAQSFEGVREEGANNRGKQIDAWEAEMGMKGDAWCMMYVQAMIKEMSKRHGKKSRVFRSAHCMTVWAKTPTDLRRTKPQAGDIVIWNHVGTQNGHTGLVIKQLSDTTFLTIEGNTGPDDNKVERNGDGVYVKRRSMAKTGDMKVVGFLRIWD